MRVARWVCVWIGLVLVSGEVGEGEVQVWVERRWMGLGLGLAVWEGLERA